jgi:hypothetical protein
VRVLLTRVLHAVWNSLDPIITMVRGSAILPSLKPQEALLGQRKKGDEFEHVDRRDLEAR